MNDTTNGIMLMALGVLLAILALALPTWLWYMFWAAVIIFILYGFYIFRKG